MDVLLAKIAKDGSPQDKHDGVNRPHRLVPGDLWNEYVDEGDKCGKAADDHGEYPVPVSVHVSLACVVEIGAVESADGDGEDELKEADEQAREDSCEASRHIGAVMCLDETHWPHGCDWVWRIVWMRMVIEVP